MNKMIFAALMLPLPALAQTYPSPTFSSVTLQNPLAASSGGTGVANSSTITLGGNLTTSGANPLILTTTGTTNVTLPTSGTILNSTTGATAGANSNITSLSGLTTPLSVPQGGTGATTSTGSGSVVLSTSPSLTTPALGVPSSVTLTNGTGLPISTGVSGLGSGVATALGNGVTGSGNVVLSTSPTLVTPALGTPSSGTLTNATGLPVSTGISGLGTGVATGLGNAATGSGGPVLATSPTIATPTFSTSATISSSATSGNSLVVSAPSNTSQGAQIELIGNGVTTPNKYMRALNGTFAVLNNADNNILTMLDNGNATFAGTVTAPSFTGAFNPTTPFSVGSSLYPNITPAITTTATSTNGSTSITVTSASGLAVGMGIYAGFVSSCSNAVAAFQSAYITNISGNTVTMSCPATATNGSPVSVQFGQNRYDANSALLVNDIGTQTLKIGAVSQGNSAAWLDQISTGQDYRFTSALQVVPSVGGGYGITVAARSSDANSGAAAFPFQSLLYLDSWGNTSYGAENAYLQDNLAAATAGKAIHIQMEQSINSNWGSPPSEDPYTTNQVNQTIAHRYDCGSGQSSGALPDNCTTAIEIVTNPKSFLNGIVFANNAIVQSGGFGAAMSMPTGDGLIWYSSAGTYAATLASKGAGQLNINVPSGSTAGLVWNNALMIGSNGPVIASGFGTGPTIPNANGTAAFLIHVGSSPGGSGVLTMPTANNGWACDAVDLSQANATQFYLRQTAVSATSVTLTMFNTSGAASSFVAGDYLSVKCTGY